MANNEQVEPSRSSRKRSSGTDLVDSMIKRIHGNQNGNRETSPSGPIFPVDDESLILNQKYKEMFLCSKRKKNQFVFNSISSFLSEFPEEAWSEQNPNGIVPVVVNPGLVSGVKFNNEKLTDDQKSGIQFLWDCYDDNTGGILAHDTGLGKVRLLLFIVNDSVDTICFNILDKNLHNHNSHFTATIKSEQRKKFTSFD